MASSLVSCTCSVSQHQHAKEFLAHERASLYLRARLYARCMGQHVVEIPILIPEHQSVGDSKHQPDPNFRDPRRIFGTSKVATSVGRDVLNLAQDFLGAPVSLVEMMILALAGTTNQTMLSPRSPRIHCVQFPLSFKVALSLPNPKVVLQGPVSRKDGLITRE